MMRHESACAKLASRANADAATALGAKHLECGSHPIAKAEIKTGWGGARIGAGRPRKAAPPSVAIGTGRDGPRWYCLEVEARREREVATAVDRIGFAAFLPQFLDRDGATLHLAIPRFAFAEFDWRDDGWRALAHTRHVRRLLGPHPERPSPIRAGEMAWLLAQFGEGGAQRTPPATLQPIPQNAVVRITAGPFAGTTGRCRASDGRRITILVGALPLTMAQSLAALA